MYCFYILGIEIIGIKYSILRVQLAEITQSILNLSLGNFNLLHDYFNDHDDNI